MARRTNRNRREHLMANVRVIDGASGTDSRSESISDLIKALRDEALLLVRQEVALAKTEMSEKIGRTLRNTAYAIAGGLVAFLGLVFILHAATALTGVGLKAAGVAPEQGPWRGAPVGGGGRAVRAST